MALSTSRELIEWVSSVPKGSRGWIRNGYNADVDNSFELVGEGLTKWQDADDTIEVVSSDNGDKLTGQIMYLRGIDTNDKVRIESFTLNGTTAVESAVAFRYVETAWLNKECAGTITIRQKTGPDNYFAITIGQLSANLVAHYNGEYTTYLTGCVCHLGDNCVDGVFFELRIYPDDADSRDVADGYIKFDMMGFIYDGTNRMIGMNPPPLDFAGGAIRVPKGSFIAVYAKGAGTDNDAVAQLYGFDVLEE